MWNTSITMNGGDLIFHMQILHISMYQIQDPNGPTSIIHIRFTKSRSYAIMQSMNMFWDHTRILKGRCMRIIQVWIKTSIFSLIWLQREITWTTINIYWYHYMTCNMTIKIHEPILWQNIQLHKINQNKGTKRFFKCIVLKKLCLFRQNSYSYYYNAFCLSMIYYIFCVFIYLIG